MTLRRALMWAGLLLFGWAALAALLPDQSESLQTILGLVAAGLACWIAATLP